MIFAPLAFASSFLLVASDTAPVQAPALPVDKFVLDNGLEVLVHEDHRLPLIAVNVTYHVGAIDEPTDRTGFAHLFEHLMFQGSKHVGDEQHLRMLSDAGGSGVNGYTTHDYTTYLETVPTNELELALWLESDRMGYLLDTLDDKKFENQREVVKNERRQRFENAPYGIMRDAMAKTLFPPTHPYFGSVIGSMSHLDAATADDAKRFFAKYYAPSNATLCLAGDITTPAAKVMVEKWFGSLKKQPKPAPTNVTIPSKPAISRLVLAERLGKLNKVQWLWLSPTVNQPGEAELDFVANLLGDGESSRLYKSLVLEQKVASSVGLANQSLAGGSIFVLDVTALPGVSAKTVETALEKAWGEALAKPFTDDEVNRVKARYETGVISGLVNLTSRARTLQVYNHYEGKPDGLAADLQRHHKLTPAELTAAMAKYLPLTNRTTIWAVPQKEVDDTKLAVGTLAAALPPAKAPASDKIEPQPDEPFRATRPKAGATPALVVPKYQSAKLKNGLTVIVNENHQFPLVQIGISVRAGGVRDPKDKPGMYGFLYDILDDGTSKLDVEALDQKLGDLGTGIASAGSRDGGVLSSLVLKKHLPELVGLMADMTIRPRLDPDDIERVRKQRMGQWLSQISNPNALAALATNARLYGETSAYGHPMLGDDRSISAFTRDQLVAAHAAGFAPQHSALILVGDISLAEAVTLAEASFQAWSNPKAGKQVAKADALKFNRDIIAIDLPKAPQTVLYLASVGPSVGHRDEEGLALALDAFGGNFNSRLNLNLREDKGITYGAGANLQAQGKTGLIIASTSVRAEATGLGLKETITELSQLKSKPFTQAELDFVRNSWLLSVTGEFETPDAAAAYAGRMFIYQQPLDAIEKDLAKVKAMTVKDLGKIADKYLRTDRFSVVLVGDPELIDKEVSGLGLGKVVHQAPPSPSAR